MIRTKLNLFDEWETQKELFDYLCKIYSIHPKIDAAATLENSKCTINFRDALNCEWKQFRTKLDVWCNPPHSITKSFVLKAHEQWLKRNINILMLVPLQSIGRKYFNEIFDNYITPKKGVEWHRIQPRPTFIHPDQEKQENARQEYIVLIWRKQK